MNLRAPACAVIVLSALLSTGCYRVTVKSGRAEAPGAPATNGSSRGGMVNGIIEENPMHMGMVCKSGWSSVYVETSFVNSFVDGFRGWLYHTQNITLRCAPETTAAPVAAGPTIIDPSSFPPGPQVAPAAPPPVAPPTGI